MRLSDKIKLELLKYYRFERQYHLVCTEGINNSDVNAYNGNSLIEVEVKISKQDFKKEFLIEEGPKHKHRWKVYKHTNYSDPHTHLSTGYVVPNRFYFCVPAELADWAREYLEEKDSKYGLLKYDENQWQGDTHIISVRSAKTLHKEQLPIRTITLLCKRASSELITAKERFLECKQELENGVEIKRPKHKRKKPL